ncbi:MAG: transcriptional repressor LexA [Eubacteriales bacterium]
METINTKQREVFEYICSFVEENQYPPSVREICEAVSLKSTSTVHYHLNKLEKAGYICKTGGKTRAIAIKEKDLPPQVETRNFVPLVGHVAAGNPILAEENIEEYLHFNTEGKVGEHFALRVRGESMIGAGILHDDLVVVHRKEEVRNGTIIVAMIEDEATVKTLLRSNGETWLMPENKEYHPIDGTHAHMLGEVVAVIRRY